MRNPREIAKLAWRVPEEVREPLARVLGDIQHTVHRRDVGRQEWIEPGFRVQLSAQGRVYVTFDDSSHFLLEGRTERNSFVDYLRAMAEGETETRHLVLEVQKLPGIEVDYDRHDLGRMAHALAEMYGHQIRVQLRIGEAEHAQEKERGDPRREG